MVWVSNFSSMPKVFFSMNFIFAHFGVYRFGRYVMSRLNNIAWWRCLMGWYFVFIISAGKDIFLNFFKINSAVFCSDKISLIFWAQKRKIQNRKKKNIQMQRSINCWIGKRYLISMKLFGRQKVSQKIHHFFSFTKMRFLYFHIRKNLSAYLLCDWQ